MFRLKIHRLVAFLLEGAFPTASRFKPISKTIIIIIIIIPSYATYRKQNIFQSFFQSFSIHNLDHPDLHFLLYFSMLQDLSSGNLTQLLNITMLLMGKSTNKMAIFNSYVSLPEGTQGPFTNRPINAKSLTKFLWIKLTIDSTVVHLTPHLRRSKLWEIII